MGYSPRNVPPDAAALAEFLRAELQRLAQDLQAKQPVIRLADTYGTPDKPRAGDVRAADGTEWDPNSGAGPYWYDGSNWVALGISHPVGCYVSGLPTASEVVLRYVATDRFVLPAGLTGSKGDAATAATAQTDWDVRKGATSVGTVRFAASATTATFIMASDTQFTPGDVLSIVAPGTPDATLAGVSMTLKGRRN